MPSSFGVIDASSSGSSSSFSTRSGKKPERTFEIALKGAHGVSRGPVWRRCAVKATAGKFRSTRAESQPIRRVAADGSVSDGIAGESFGDE